VHSGDTIASLPPLAISDLIKKTDGILDSSQAALKNVTVATDNISSITSKIDQGQGTVGELINDKKIYGELDQTIAGLPRYGCSGPVRCHRFQENMEALETQFLPERVFQESRYADSAEWPKMDVESSLRPHP